MSRTGIGAARRGGGALANRPKDGQIAQGRNYDRVRLQDLPEPEDVGDKDGPLDQAELELRGMCDKAINDWDDSTVVLAKALANYRGRRLYRDTHADYDSWCQDRFQKTRYWALRLEDSYEVTAALMLPAGNMDDVDGAAVEVTQLMPTQHSRELKQAEREGGPDEMRAVYEETAAAGKVTGAALKATRERRKAQREQRQPEPDEIVDAEIVEDDSPSIDDQLKDAQQLLQTLRAAFNAWAPAMKGLNDAGVAGIPLRQDIGRVVRMLGRANEHDNA